MVKITNLRLLRNKIRSVENLKKITRAMQMVAAAKLRKAQDKLTTLRDYETELSKISNRVISTIEGPLDKWTREKASEKQCIVAFSSEKGLCGTYNSNLFRYLEKNVDDENTDWIACGKKINSYLRKTGRNVIKNMDTKLELTEETISGLSEELMQGFTSGKYRRVSILYTKFKNVLIHQPTVTNLLPVQIETGSTGLIEPLFEPEPEEIFENLISYQIGTSLFLLYIESLVSEHAARMNAMRKATDNTEKMIKELTLIRNKVRQAAITKELLDIVTGAEALKK